MKPLIAVLVALAFALPAQAKHRVGQPPAPVPTDILSASPTTIAQGGSSNLAWTSTGATSCAGTNFSTGGATFNSGVSVSPVVTTTYSITCHGIVASATVTVTGIAPNVSLKSLQSTGTMALGSPTVTLASNPGFQVGDGIIIETGGEAGAGARGTVGVGGVWPALSYASVTAMNADTGQPANTLAWIRDASGVSGTVGDIYQWQSPSWVFDPFGDFYYRKAIPKALVGFVCTVSGTTLTLSTPGTPISACASNPFNAAIATAGAKVYYDNSPILNGLWSGAVAATFTYTMPGGTFAVGSELDVNGGSSSSPLNSIIQGQGGNPTCSTTLLSPKGATSANMMVNAYGLTFRNFCMTGNSRQAGYGLDWQQVTQTSVTSPFGVPNAFFVDTGIGTRLANVSDTFQNLTLLNTWGAINATFSGNVTINNVAYTAQDPILTEQWAFACSDTTVGCNYSNISVTSNNGLTPGFTCAISTNCTMTNVTSVNGLFDIDDSGTWKIQGANITITANSVNAFSSAPGPIMAVTGNLGTDLIGPGQFNNFTITEQGTGVDANHNALYGVQLGSNVVKNISLDADNSSSTFSAPFACGSGARYGAVVFDAFAANAAGANESAANVAATGSPCAGEANFQFQAGVGDSCANVTGTVIGITCSGPSTYVGPCDLVTCAEAYSVTRAMTNNYNGPLLQLVSVNTSATLDIGQTTNRTADMTTWSNFCTAQVAVCRISKVYSQIHTGVNNLTPDIAVNANCMQAPTENCASKFDIESGTGLFIMDQNLGTVAMYNITGDAAATGITGGTGPQTVMMNAQIPPSPGPAGICGGTFGTSHPCTPASCVDVGNTLHEIGFYFGTTGSIPCVSGTLWCSEADYEGQGDAGPDTASKNVIFMSSVLPNTSTFTYATVGTLNGVTQWNHSRMTGGSPGMVRGTQLRLGAGGDFCQPAALNFREGFITNTQMTSGNESAVRANMTSFYSGLTFP